MKISSCSSCLLLRVREQKSEFKNIEPSFVYYFHFLLKFEPWLPQLVPPQETQPPDLSIGFTGTECSFYCVQYHLLWLPQSVQPQETQPPDLFIGFTGTECSLYLLNLQLLSFLIDINRSFRVTAKKVSFLVTRPLRGGGVRAWAQRKNNFF